MTQAGYAFSRRESRSFVPIATTMPDRSARERRVFSRMLNPSSARRPTLQSEVTELHFADALTAVDNFPKVSAPRQSESPRMNRPPSLDGSVVDAYDDVAADVVVGMDEVEPADGAMVLVVVVVSA